MARQKNNENGGADFFSHDIDMRNDIKVKALRRKYSHTGYAVWCFMLEYLTDCTNFEMDYNEVTQELLAADFDVSVEELKEIISYSVKIGLLQQEAGKLFSAAHKRRFVRMLEVRKRRAEAARKNGRKGGNPNFKKGQPNPYYQTTQSVMEDNQNITQDNPIVEYSNVEESKAKHKETTKVVKKNARRFSAPTVDDVRAYAQEKGYSIDAEHFVDYYTSNGWRVGRNPMKDWKATVRMWAARDRAQTPVQGTQSLGVGEFINSKGIRTYGTSGQPVPQDAPPRPSEAHYWSDTTKQWEKTI